MARNLIGNIGGNIIGNNTEQRGENNDRRKTVRELTQPDVCFDELYGACPKFTVDFEIKSTLVRSLPKFHGIAGDNPYMHLNSLHIQCMTLKPVGAKVEDVMWKVFHLTLEGKAREWYMNLPRYMENPYQSWTRIRRAFLEQYFPSKRATTMRQEIASAQQKKDESFFEYWSRFQKLISECPNHQIRLVHLVQYFYNGLLPYEADTLSAAANGSIEDLTPEGAWDLIRRIALCRQHTEIRDTGYVKEAESTQRDPLLEKLANDLVKLATAVESLEAQRSQSQQLAMVSTMMTPYEQDSSLKDNDMQLLLKGMDDLKSTMKNQMTVFGKQCETHISTVCSKVEQLETKHDSLSEFVSQLAISVKSLQAKVSDSTPSMHSSNPKALNAITLRSGKHVKFAEEEEEDEEVEETIVCEGPSLSSKKQSESSKENELLKKPKTTEKSGTKEKKQESELQVEKEKEKSKKKSEPKESKEKEESSNQGASEETGKEVNIQDLPFPNSYLLCKKGNEIANDKEILDLFSKVEVNIPLLDLIKKVPKYAKCLKDLCTTKRKYRPKDRVQISSNVSALFKPQFPVKCPDPGSFTIPCIIGRVTIGAALLDLGAAINVMPKSVYRSLGLKTLQPTSVILQLADKTIRRPDGIIEDLLVQVKGLLIPADFYVLDMAGASSHDSTLILGRPFLRTANTIVSMKEGTISMEVGDQKVNFNMYETMKHPYEDYPPLDVSAVDAITDEYEIDKHYSNPLHEFDFPSYENPLYEHKVTFSNSPFDDKCFLTESSHELNSSSLMTDGGAEKGMLSDISGVQGLARTRIDAESKIREQHVCTPANLPSDELQKPNIETPISTPSQPSHSVISPHTSLHLNNSILICDAGEGVSDKQPSPVAELDQHKPDPIPGKVDVQLKKPPDRRTRRRYLIVGDKVIKVLDGNRIKDGKRKASWCGPFTVVKIHHCGAVELLNDKKGTLHRSHYRQLKFFKENFKPP